MKRLFVAGPFKSLVCRQTGQMAEHHIAIFATIITYFEQKGWMVHSAHRRESWGKEMMTPEQCTRIDYDEIDQCDYLVAFPGSPASPGTHIELGWASALQKPIVLVLEKEREYAFLVRGLHRITAIESIEYDSRQVDPQRIEHAIARLEMRKADATAI